LFLGSEKSQIFAKNNNILIFEKLRDLVGVIFSKTGGTPVPQRSIQRQKYRLEFLERALKKY